MRQSVRSRVYEMRHYYQSTLSADERALFDDLALRCATARTSRDRRSVLARCLSEQPRQVALTVQGLIEKARDVGMLEAVRDVLTACSWCGGIMEQKTPGCVCRWLRWNDNLPGALALNDLASRACGRIVTVSMCVATTPHSVVLKIRLIDHSTRTALLGREPAAVLDDDGDGPQGRPTTIELPLRVFQVCVDVELLAQAVSWEDALRWTIEHAARRLSSWSPP